MFSGIVEGMASVRGLAPPAPRGAGGPLCRRLTLDGGALLLAAGPGASVAVNGVCLTVVRQEGGVAEFDVVVETLRRTNLGSLRRGDPVNLERALPADGRIEGHFVQGHVDAVGRVLRVDRRGGEHRVWIGLDADPLRFVIPKGSVALDGVSLTVVDVARGRFSVVLIPTTLERTTLGRRVAGDAVNVETDVLVRAVVESLARAGIAAGATPRRTAAARALRSGAGS